MAKVAKTLEAFTVARASEGYLLQIEDEDGDKLELTLSFDQLELISEEIERALEEDEEDELAYDDDDEATEELKDED